MITICVPVLKRYDLLQRMVHSLRDSTVRVGFVQVIDNGRDERRLYTAMRACPVPYDALHPAQPMGVAESWNWFLQNTEEERVIVNDDVLFTPTSLERMLACKADLVWAASCGFSCFAMRDACIEKIGYFDETISPGYGYYEDEDYLQRLDGRGTRAPSAVAVEVECGVQHLRSQTLAVASPSEMSEHHRKFKIAQRNYARKWHLEEAFGLPKERVMA